MKKLYIYSHLGLGDMIVMNGAVRHFSESYDKVFVFCKKENQHNVEDMYKDKSNIHLIIMNDNEIKLFLSMNKSVKCLIAGHTIGFTKDVNKGIPFDKKFYDMLNLSHQIKWDKFNYEKNLEKQKEAYYDIYNLKDGEEYIVVHQSEDRRVYKNIPKNIRIIEPNNKDVKLFDHMLILEKAKELHLMNSSFLNLVNCSKLKTNGLYYHQYARPNLDPALTNNWIIYE